MNKHQGNVMNSRNLLLGLVAAGALGLGGYGLYELGKRHGGSTAMPPAVEAVAAVGIAALPP